MDLQINTWPQNSYEILKHISNEIVFSLYTIFIFSHFSLQKNVLFCSLHQHHNECEDSYLVRLYLYVVQAFFFNVLCRSASVEGVGCLNGYWNFSS